MSQPEFDEQLAAVYRDILAAGITQVTNRACTQHTWHDLHWWTDDPTDTPRSMRWAYVCHGGAKINDPNDIERYLNS